MWCIMLILASLPRILNSPAKGDVMTQGHGMVLAMHLMKLLKSSRKFVDLMTNKFNHLKSIHCLRSIHQKLKFDVTTKPELKSHIFSFVHPGNDGELSSLYKCVVSSMVAIHKHKRQPSDLIQIAQLW